jgi:hypothetical protein
MTLNIVFNIVPPVSAQATKLAICVTEDFWFSVGPRRVKISQRSSAPPTRLAAEKPVRVLRRATRMLHSAEDQIRMVLEALVFEQNIENTRK